MVVATHLDVAYYRPRIWREDDGSWRGSVGFLQRRRSPSARKRLRIAVAGTVAESVWFKHEVALGEVSPADWEFTEIHPSRWHVEHRVQIIDAILYCQRLLRRDGPWWPLLVDNASDLIIEASTLVLKREGPDAPKEG